MASYFLGNWTGKMPVLLHGIQAANFLFFKRIARILLRSPVSLHCKPWTAALETKANGCILQRFDDF
jgi:hypothetical protein